MPNSPILFEIVVVFGAALVVIALSHRLRIPSVVGFLLAGVLIGPSVLGLVPDTHRVEGFAELAVALMLFVIGLELSSREIRRLGRLFALGGGLQAGLTTALGAGVALLFGARWPLALFCGMVLTLSSTAIVLKIYSDRREIGAPHGRLALGVLLFQDVLIVPMLLIVPVLAGSGGGVSTLAVLGRLFEGLVVVVAVFLAGRFLVPKLLGYLARTGVHELILLAALFACLGTALITHHMGLSMALGSFLAGVALADSEVRHQMQAQIAPLRDVFASIFFTSIGMLLSLADFMDQLVWVLAATAAILVGKAAMVIGAARLLNFPIRTSVFAALGLCQIGEFAFILLQAGKTEGLVPDELYSLLIAASVVSMLLTPVTMALAPALATALSTRFAAGAPETADEEEEEGHGMRDHVVIAGWGLGGRLLSRVLRQGGIRQCVVDLDLGAVREARAEGLTAFFGDIASPDLQHEAGLDRAAVAVFALSDAVAQRQAISWARSLNPGLHIIVRTKQIDAIEEQLELGANEVVTQDLETCIEIVRRVFSKLNLPRHLIRSAASWMHEDHYAALLAPRPRTGLSATLLEAATAGTAETFLLPPGHEALGKTIRDLDLRRTTGVTILAVLRGEEVVSAPKAEMELIEGDSLVLVGDHAALDVALRHLEGHEPEDDDG